jgi:hypothetical protein
VADLLFIAIVLAFFALAAGFVRLCDRIIGPDTEFDLASDDEPAPLEPVAVEGAAS